MTRLTRTSPGLVLFITTLSAFCTSFAASSVNIALPLIGAEFHLGGVTLNWVVTAFVLTSAVLVMPFGRLADLHGRQKVFRWGMNLYLVASVGAALAPDVVGLIVARSITGIGAAMALGTVSAVLVAAYPPKERGRILGINVAMVYVGLSTGPVFGGFLTQILGWRSLFWLHAGLSLGVVLVATQLTGDDRETHHEGFDLVGSVLYALGLSVLLMGFSHLPGLVGTTLTLGGSVLLVGFWIFESKTKSPILPVVLFTKNRTFAFSNLAAIINYSATFGIAFFLSLYLEVVRGLTPSQAGLMLLCQPLVQAVFSPFIGKLSDRVAPRFLASMGMGLTALGLVLLALLDSQTPLALVVGTLVLVGLGFALFSSPNTNAILGSVEKRDLGLASATVATMRTVGQMLSMGLTLLLLSLILGAREVNTASSQGFLVTMRWGFGISAALCTLGIGASLARGPGRTQAD